MPSSFKVKYEDASLKVADRSFFIDSEIVAVFLLHTCDKKCSYDITTKKYVLTTDMMTVFVATMASSKDNFVYEDLIVTILP